MLEHLNFTFLSATAIRANQAVGGAGRARFQGRTGKLWKTRILMETKRFPPGRWAPSYWEKPKDRERKLHPGKCLCSTLGSLASFE